MSCDFVTRMIKKYFSENWEKQSYFTGIVQILNKYIYTGLKLVARNL